MRFVPPRRTRRARCKGLQSGQATEIESAYASLVGQQITALVIGGDPLFVTRGSQLVELAARHRVVTIYSSRGPVQAGGLISYGASRAEATRIAGLHEPRDRPETVTHADFLERHVPKGNGLIDESQACIARRRAYDYDGAAVL